MSTASVESVQASVKSVESIMNELRHVQRALRQLNEPEHYNHLNNRFVKPTDEDWFRVQKQRYKHVKDEAWWWLKNHGKDPRPRVDYEKGFYFQDVFHPSEAGDIG